MLARISVNDDPETIAAEFLKSGAVIVEDFLAPEVVARFNTEIDPYVDAAVNKGFVNDGLAYFFREQTRTVSGLANKSDTLVNEIMVHPVYMHVADRVLGPNCNSFQMNSAIILDRGPGSEGQTLHRDEGNWDRTAPVPYQYHFGSMIALTEFTRENGATLVVPGSHEWPSDREARPEEIEVAEMRPGSVVMYLGSTLHAAAENRTSDTWRRGLHVSYCLGWLRAEENHFLSTDLERVRKMPPQAQALLGYAVHDRFPRFGGGYSGAVDMRNPMDLMASGEL